MKHMNNEIKEDLINKINNSGSTPYEVKEKFLKFIENNPNSFYGREKPEHITSSVLVIDQEHENVLLTHHRKFNKWLQLGGHWMDTEIQENIFDGGVREVFEEGYNNQVIPYTAMNNGNPIDLDAHQAGNDFHYDVCFLVEVDKSIPFKVSPESKDLAWIPIADIIDDLTHEKYNARLNRLCFFALDACNRSKKNNP